MSARFSSPPDPAGFNAQVWEIVRQIPPGRVIAYGQLAVLIPPPSGMNPKDYLAWGARWVGGALDPLPVKVDGGILFAPAGEIVPVALRSIEKGGTLAVAGIWLSAIPSLDYERELFYERNLRSVTANTRADGEALLAEAAAIPLRPRVTAYPLAEANRVLQLLKADQLNGTGVLVP